MAPTAVSYVGRVNHSPSVLGLCEHLLVTDSYSADLQCTLGRVMIGSTETEPINPAAQKVQTGQGAKDDQQKTKESQPQHHLQTSDSLAH